MGTKAGDVTATKDKDDNLVWFVEQSLSNALRLQNYGENADALDGFAFLTMTEAGEVGHWSVLRRLNERARHGDVQELVEWVLPIQARHLQAVLDGSLQLAGQEDPDESSRGACR
jgi:hypothetical protein